MFEKLKLKRKINILKKQIASGNLQSMYDLAMIYLDGTIIKKNEAEAQKLLQKAAENGHLPSKTYLLSNKIVNCINTGSTAISNIIETLKK